MKKHIVFSAFAATVIAGSNLTCAQERAAQTTTNPLVNEAELASPVKPEAPPPPGGFVPLQIRETYSLDFLANNGAGQVIALVEPCGNPNLESDLEVFCSQFGLPATTIQVLGKAATPTADRSGALKTSQDVEWTHALAPKASIVVSVADSGKLGDLMSAANAAVGAGATVVSMSYNDRRAWVMISAGDQPKKLSLALFRGHFRLRNSKTIHDTD